MGDAGRTDFDRRRSVDDMGARRRRGDRPRLALHRQVAEDWVPTQPPEIFTGRVMAIGQEGEFATERDVRRGRQDIRTFYVKVQALQAEGELKPGMTAEVTFPRTDGTRITSNTDQRPD